MSMQFGATNYTKSANMTYTKIKKPNQQENFIHGLSFYLLRKFKQVTLFLRHSLHIQMTQLTDWNKTN